MKSVKLTLGGKEYNRKLRKLREQTRIARKPEPIRLWGIWNEFKPKKQRQTDFGEYGDAHMDDAERYIDEDDNETMRLPANEPYKRRDKPFRVEMPMEAAARVNDEIEDMFNSFKGNHYLSEKEKERINNL